MGLKHFLLIIATFGLLGCSVLSPQPPAKQRFFHPLTNLLPAAKATLPAVTLRLGRISSAPYLRDRMIVRLSDVEVAFDEQDRWAAPPELLIEHAVYRVLARERGFVLTESPSAPLLDLVVVRFDGDMDGRKAWVVLDATVQDRRTGELHWHRKTTSAPISAGSPEALARAIGVAVSENLLELADWLRTLPLTESAAKP